MVHTRVVIADDHTLFRSSVRQLLESKPHLKVVGEAASGPEAVTLVRKLAPDILLLDMRFPNLSGLDVLQQLGPPASTRVILLTAGLESGEVVQAIQYSARGVVLKDAATQSLFNSIDTVMSGQYWIHGAAVSDPHAALRGSSERRRAELRPRRCCLTPREFDVVKAIASGHTNKEIAGQLAISEQTVKHHVTNIFNKTGVSNRLELTLFAVEQRLVEVPRPQEGKAGTIPDRRLEICNLE